MAIQIYVADEDWNRGRGHQARFEALSTALRNYAGDHVVRAVSPHRAAVSIDAAGNAVLMDDTVLDGLEYSLAPVSPFLRPTTPRTDPEGVAVVCYPSTLALEMICLGYRVALLPPRNEGERALALKLMACPDPFAVVDGWGAQRVAERVLATLTAAPPPGSADATPRSAPRDPPG